MPNSSTKKQNLLQILLWSSAVKIIFSFALVAILVVLSLSGTLIFNAWPVIYILFPLVAVNAILLILAKKKISWAGLLVYPEIVLNIVVITFFIHFSWADHAEFLFLYIMPAFTASLVSLRTLNVTFALCIIGYGIEHYITMTRGSQFSAFVAEVLSGEELSDFFLLFLIIAAIGFQARYYIGRIKEADDKLMALKDEFLFRTVHDLRSPASTARFILEKYENYDFGKGNPEEIREDIKTIGNLNQDLLAMVEDLLQVAKGEQKDVHLSLESIDVKEMIGSILSEFSQEISQKGIELNYSPDNLPMVWADRLRLREVFANLIENAVKYNQTGGIFSILHEKNKNFLITHFSNSSVDSLKQEDLEKFFKPYAQIGRDEVSGNGLGLYIVKKLVEKMAGEVKMDFDSGKNIIAFHVSLPLAENERQPK